MRRLRYSRLNKASDGEINMSPLIDIVFILLIFFIVTTVFKNDPGVEVNVPQANSATVMKGESVMLAVSRDGQVYHGGRNIGLEGVQDVVRAFVLENEDVPIVVQCDVNALHGKVLMVVDEARLAGAKQVFSATER